MHRTNGGTQPCVFGFVFGAASIIALIGCGRTASDMPALGEDASPASGGSIGQGGEPASGGVLGAGGAVSSGGVVGSGGVLGSGGSIGRGGVPGSGGSVGRGGTLGSGGSVGRGGTPAVGGVVGRGGTTNPGGGAATAGTGGKGGAIGLGGVVGRGGTNGSGGVGGWRTGTVVSPRPPAGHRAEASSCVGVHAPAEPNITTTSRGSCTKHADCTQGTNGRCIHGIGNAYNYFYCVYDQCGSDADCDAGKVCFCTASDAARCLSVGNCRTDADCGGGDYSYCSPSMGTDCGGYHSIDSYHCHTPKDTCIDNSDCSGTDYCNFDAYDGRWKCAVPNMMCAIG
jgi:hypothetical protein